MQSESDKRPEIKDLREALRGTSAGLKAFLRQVHPADLAEWLEEFDDADDERVLDALDVEGRAELMKFAEKNVQQRLLDRLDAQQIVAVVEDMPADEVVDLLALTEEAKAEQILRGVDFERAQGLRELASYHEESAGGLMTTEYVAIREDCFVSDAIKEIKSEEGPAGEEEIGVFVIDEAGKPVGFVSDRELLTTPIHTPIRDVMEKDLIIASAEDDQEDVAHLARKYSLSAIPVIDKAGVLIGVISGEDVQDVLEDEAEEDILRLVGTSPEEQTRLPVLLRVRHRLPLQALTVLGGLVTARILSWALPDSVQSSSGDVLRYLPIIIGLAGNVGVQSSTVLVRAIATGELVAERHAAVLRSEVLVGCIIGVLCGLATALFAFFFEGGAGFGLAVGTAIAIAMTWAAFLGCVVPMVCERFGIDPAIVAGPFLISLSDVSGAAIFVFIADLSLGLGS